MKNRSHRLIATLVLSLLLLVGCTTPAAPTEPPEPASWVMEYPGLRWGMTPDEARTALELTDEQQSIGDYLVLHDIRMTVFGAENADVYLYFADNNGDDTWLLFRVMAFLPYNTDMEAMAQQIETHYDTATQLTEEEKLNYAGEPMTAKQWKWESDALLQDIMSEYDTEFILSKHEHYHSILTDPATTITLDNDGYFDHTLDGMHTKNLLTISSMVTYYQFEGGYRNETEPAAQTE